MRKFTLIIGLALMPLVVSAADACVPCYVVKTAKKIITVAQSYDPNEMAGPAGVGAQRYVKPGEPMDYTIYFENQTNATAAAIKIAVTMPKDANLDWSTLELGEVVFGDHTDAGFVDDKTARSIKYALADSGCEVRTTVTETDSDITWNLRIWDPNTTDHFPDDFNKGVLPPNDPENHCGEGHIRFRVNVKNDATPNTRINASASIVFDDNPAIITDPAWWNTVAPDSYMLTLTPNNTKYGTVSGGGTYKIGATATLKATAKSGYAFAGWFTDKACTKPLNPKGYDNRSPTVKVVVPENDTTIYAKFVTAAEAKKSLKFSSATAKLAKTPAKATAGGKFSLKLGISSASLVTVTATGLPKGLKIDKATGAITGTATVVGDFTATVTVKDAAGNKITQKVKITVRTASYAKGTFYGTAKPGKKKGDPMAYLQFTVGSTGKVSGKVTYKGKAYSFKSTLSSCTASKAKFSPKVKVGKKTFKPGAVTIRETESAGGRLVEAANSKGTFTAQKKANLVKKGKALAKLVGKTFTFTKETKNSGLTKSGDKLKVKLADGDRVTASGTVNGKKLAALSAPLIVSKVSALDGMTTYTLYADILDAKAKYYRTVVFTVKVPVVLKPVPKVSARFAK